MNYRLIQKQKPVVRDVQDQSRDTPRTKEKSTKSIYYIFYFKKRKKNELVCRYCLPVHDRATILAERAIETWCRKPKHDLNYPVVDFVDDEKIIIGLGGKKNLLRQLAVPFALVFRANNNEWI